LLAAVLLASGQATRSLLARTFQRAPETIDIGIARLERDGWLLSAGRERLMATGMPAQDMVSAAERVELLTQLLAATEHGTLQRLILLIVAGRREAVASEAALVATRCYAMGHIADAEVALSEGLIAARDSAHREERSLIVLSLRIALDRGTQRALELTLNACHRASLHRSELTDIELLGEAALLALRGQARRALEAAELAGPGRTFDIELVRWSIRIAAVRAASLDEESRLVEQAREWAAFQSDPLVVASAAGWLGWLRYRQRRFAEAAEQHTLAARLHPIESRRLASQLDAASAWLEAGELELARDLASQAENTAQRARHPLFEGRAAQLVRSADYRAQCERAADLELVDGIAACGLEFREALAALTEAAFAWRSGEFELSNRLAMRAELAFRRVSAPEGELVARALALATQRGKYDAAELHALAERATSPERPGVGLQALALIATVDPQVASAFVSAAQGLYESTPESTRAVRREVLSADEALHILQQC
jgi:hypothetical protein